MIKIKNKNKLKFLLCMHDNKDWMKKKGAERYKLRFPFNVLK